MIQGQAACFNKLVPLNPEYSYISQKYTETLVIATKFCKI